MERRKYVRAAVFSLNVKLMSKSDASPDGEGRSSAAVSDHTVSILSTQIASCRLPFQTRRWWESRSRYRQPLAGWNGAEQERVRVMGQPWRSIPRAMDPTSIRRSRCEQLQCQPLAFDHAEWALPGF